MKDSNLKYTIIGFLGGILATVVTGFFNFEINRQNKMHEEKMQDRKEKELIVNVVAELQSAYQHLKYDFHNNVSCDTTYNHYITASDATIKLLGNQQILIKNKITSLDLISELDFIVTNYCKTWKLYNDKKNPAIGVIINGKLTKEFIFEGNLHKTDSLFGKLYVELFVKK